MAIAKHNLQRRKPLRRAGRRLEWNPEPRDLKKLLFANILGLTGVSDNHSPTESRCNPALASQIDPSAMASGFLQNDPWSPHHKIRRHGNVKLIRDASC